MRATRWGRVAVLMLWAVLAPRVVASQDATTKPQPAPVGVFRDGGVLVLKTPDEQFRWWLDGRVMLDAAAYRGSDNPLSHGAELRRGRIGFKMIVWKNWGAEFEVDFADNQTRVKDMWLGYLGFPNSMIKVGQFTEPFGLETIVSSLFITFTERSLVDNLSPDRHLGITYSRWGSRWQAQGGVFAQGIGTVDVTGEDQGYAVTGRVTGVPLMRADRLLHLGVAASYRTPDAGVDPTGADRHQLRVSARPETHVSRSSFLDTGTLENVRHSSRVGLELAAVLGSFSLQSEYARMTVSDSTDARRPALHGWYGYASWFPSGDHRVYYGNVGEFGRVIPRHKRGAFELAARYSTLDLNDPTAGVRGGQERILTAGFNWYANPNIRLTVNYSWVANDEFATGGSRYTPSDRFDIIQSRFQLHF